MIENCINQEVYMGLQSIGLLAIAWRFSLLQKEVIKSNYNDRCAVTGTKRHLEVHHRVPVCMGGSDHIDNGVPLTTRVHKPWDEKTINEGIVYPGIPISEAPDNLFTSKRAREITIFKFRDKLNGQTNPVQSNPNVLREPQEGTIGERIQDSRRRWNKNRIY